MVSFTLLVYFVCLDLLLYALGNFVVVFVCLFVFCLFVCLFVCLFGGFG